MADTIPNDASNVGQDKPIKDYVEQYDNEHGRYQSNVPVGPPNIPNANPAGSDPSPFKLGGK